MRIEYRTTAGGYSPVRVSLATSAEMAAQLKTAGERACRHYLWLIRMEKRALSQRPDLVRFLWKTPRVPWWMQGYLTVLLHFPAFR